MSYGEDDELDWGEEDYKHLGDADAVDVVSLGDEEEIQVVDFPTEGVVEVPAPASAVQTPREPPTSPNKTRLGLASQSSLGLSHLPPKPRTVVAGGRSRETIKAAAMARPHARSRSPPGADLPHNWEIRRSDLTVYYYHTVLCASQLKRPTREDARLDSKSCWKGEAPPPSPLVRSQSARNAPSGRAAWPEHSPPSRRQKSPNRAPTPPRAGSPSSRSAGTPDITSGRGRSNSSQHQTPRGMSPSSMLLPRRGQSPARGLVKNGNDATNDEPSGRTGTDDSDGGPADIEEYPRAESWDRRAERSPVAPLLRRDHYSPEREVERPSRDIGFGQVPKDAVGSRRSRHHDVARGGMDHYSPPPEDDDEPHPHRHSSRRRSLSPRRTGMRSDDILSNQYTSRRSISPPRSHPEPRSFDRQPFDRMHSESRMRSDATRGRGADDSLKEREDLGPPSNRRFNERDQRLEGHEFLDLRGDELPDIDPRLSHRDRHLHAGISPRDLPMPLHGRNGDPFPGVEMDGPGYHEVPPGIHPSRSERFHGRPDIQRAHSSRISVHPSRVEGLADSPRLSPHAIRNDAPLPPRHEYPPRDRVMSRVRSQNGGFREGDALGLRDRDLHRDVQPEENDAPTVAEDRELHASDSRGVGRSRHGRGRGPQGGYMANQEFDTPGFPEHRSGTRVFSGRDRGFPREQDFQPQEQAFQGGEREFDPREDARFQPKERFEARGGHREHEHDLSPHTREHMLSHEGQMVPPNRAFIPQGSQRRDPPPHSHVIHPREQDPHFQDRTSRTWERGVEVPTPPPEQGRFDGRGRESGSRKDRREGGVEAEYAGSRGDRRRADGEESSTFESERKGAGNRHGRWVTREANSNPSARGGPATHRMDMDVDPEPSPSARTDPLPGWAEFRQRDRATDTAKSARSLRSRRDGRPAVEGEHDMPGIESEEDSRKRRRIEDGSNMSTKPGRDEPELPRKIPQSSNTQSQAPHSPINSVLPAPHRTLSTSPTASLVGPVDFEAARARAKDVASQLARVNPSPGRPKSRFGAPLVIPALGASIPVKEEAAGGPPAKPEASLLPTVTTSSGGPSVDVPSIVARPAPAHKRKITTDGDDESKPAAPSADAAKDDRHHSQGSEDSSTLLVTRMVDASLGDTKRAEDFQRSGGRLSRYQDNGWNGRDRGRQDGNRNGLDRHPRRPDSWRPDDEPRDSPMRAWGKQEPGTQKEGPSTLAFTPIPRSSYVPRHAQERNLIPRELRNRPPEGLPPKPPSPSQFYATLSASGAHIHSSSSSGRARSPQRNRLQISDADMADVISDTLLDGSKRAPGAISFLPASSPTDAPRKSSLLHRMTDPNGGALMARISTGDQGGSGDNPRQRRPKINRPGPGPRR